MKKKFEKPNSCAIIARSFNPASSWSPHQTIFQPLSASRMPVEEPVAPAIDDLRQLGFRAAVTLAAQGELMRVPLGVAEHTHTDADPNIAPEHGHQIGGLLLVDEVRSRVKQVRRDQPLDLGQEAI
ncbi:hypothetical protein NLM33_13610 [Bradyrhizobium sp. CCGUVB1N3]|uniref:hypothetical protein n=1 Tax=Bradyrhizobium sp. CCGUVB1N3 TaxID=2949629 RepID=UPI0020B1ECBE|nr:hypothetical protein [Bradyrhizobium sp. CCGUVB1N3]MCP3471368.1 hypothetical protein [Bradyrhizobium sp. CCGUVB1N3]